MKIWLLMLQGRLKHMEQLKSNTTISLLQWRVDVKENKNVASWTSFKLLEIKVYTLLKRCEMFARLI